MKECAVFIGRLCRDHIWSDLKLLYIFPTMSYFMSVSAVSHFFAALYVVCSMFVCVCLWSYATEWAKIIEAIAYLQEAWTGLVCTIFTSFGHEHNSSTVCSHELRNTAKDDCGFVVELKNVTKRQWPHLFWATHYVPDKPVSVNIASSAYFDWQVCGCSSLNCTDAADWTIGSTSSLTVSKSSLHSDFVETGWCQVVSS